MSIYKDIKEKGNFTDDSIWKNLKKLNNNKYDAIWKNIKDLTNGSSDNIYKNLKNYFGKDNIPKNFNELNNLVIDLDSKSDYLDLSTISGVSYVNSWRDKWNLNNKATQEIAVNRPIFSSSGITFDGINDYLETNISFKNWKNFTIIVQGIPESNDTPFVIGSDNVQTQKIYLGYWVDGYLYYIIRTIDSDGLSIKRLDLEISENTTIVYVYDNSESGWDKMKLYLNGEEVDMLTSSAYPPTDAGISSEGIIQIGRGIVSATQYYSKGIKKKVKIYNKVLTEKEIKNICG
jgi:hypothetical protein